jgi:hypothetical protein
MNIFNQTTRAHIGRCARSNAAVPSRRHAVAGAATALALVLAGCGGDKSTATSSSSTGSGTTTTTASGAYDSQLAFDKTNYTTLTVTIDGTAVPVRWYKEVCYVAKPVAMQATQSGLMGSTTYANPTCGWESMNIFVPESIASSQDAAIYFAVNNAGWMNSYVAASVTDGASFDSASSNVGAALKAGYVYIDVGTRGRGLVAADGSYAGHAPAVIVDAKAAVRYLKLNDSAMPGNAKHIVVNGTSGGGGLSSILGASGNSTDYLSYLNDVGAAGIAADGTSTLKDDVLAINAYCPITDLGNADVIYEWLFNILNTRSLTSEDPNPSGSTALMAKFNDYETSLGLKNADGDTITADNALEELRQEVIKSAAAYMAAGNTIPNLGETLSFTSSGFGGTTTTTYTNDFIAVDNANAKVLAVDLARYLASVATMTTLKPTPSFDQTGVSAAIDNGGNGGETNLFGTSTQAYSNFTEYSWMNNDTAGDGSGVDDTGLTWARFTARSSTVVVKQADLINPLHYIGTSGATTAPYWYVRHGSRDRDTAALVSINLARALKADSVVKDLNYRLAWGQPHAGNYDVPEAMAWITTILADARTRGL